MIQPFLPCPGEAQCRPSGVVPGCAPLSVQKSAFSASSVLIRRLEGSASPSHSPFSSLSVAKYFLDSFLMEASSVTLSSLHSLTCLKCSCRKRTVLCRHPSHTRKNCVSSGDAALPLLAPGQGKKTASLLLRTTLKPAALCKEQRNACLLPPEDKRAASHPFHKRRLSGPTVLQRLFLPCPGEAQHGRPVLCSDVPPSTESGFAEYVRPLSSVRRFSSFTFSVPAQLFSALIKCSLCFLPHGEEVFCHTQPRTDIDLQKRSCRRLATFCRCLQPYMKELKFPAPPPLFFF